MLKYRWIMVYAVVLLLLIGCLKNVDRVPSAGMGAAGRSDVLYACDSGDCNTLSKSPGKCACGKELRWHHVIRVEGDEALLCTCDEGCQCAQSKTEPARCACGNLAKRVSLRNSELFFCNCGGSCSCNNISDKLGECRCGMKLKQAS